MDGFNDSPSCPHICECICHTEEGVSHVMACCTKCKLCDRKIKTFSLEGHKATCHKEEHIADARRKKGPISQEEAIKRAREVVELDDREGLGEIKGIPPTKD